MIAPFLGKHLTLLIAALTLGAVGSLAESTNQTITFYHRFLPSDPTVPPPPFSLRSKIHLSSPANSHGLASVLPVIVGDIEDLSSLRPVDTEKDAFYQIAMEVEGEDEALWPKTVMKAVSLGPYVGRDKLEGRKT